MPACTMTTLTLHIHRLRVLCEASMKPHSPTSCVAMCDSGDHYFEAYVPLAIYGKAVAEGSTSIPEGALENGDRTHALSRMPSLARAPRGLTYGSRVLSCTAQASFYAWRAWRTCCSRALLAAAARRYGFGPFGIIAFAALSRDCHAHRPCAEVVRGRPVGRCDGAGACCGSLYDL